MMEEEFDEFQEATYSHSQPSVQKPSPSPQYSAHAVQGLEPLHDSHALDLTNPSPGILPPPTATEGLEDNSPFGGEPIWPSAGKTNSVHVPAQQPSMIDFSKSYSQAEPINTPIAQGFISFDIAEQSKSSTLNFLDQPPSAESPLQTFFSNPVANNGFLMQFSPQQNGFEPFGSEAVNVVGQDLSEEVEILQNTEANNYGTNLYTPLGLIAADDFGLFTPMTENTAISSEKQVKAEQKQQTGLVVNDDHLFQFASSEPQSTLEINAIVPETKVTFPVNLVAPQEKPEDDNWMQPYTAPPSTTAAYDGFDDSQPTIIETEIEAKAEGERKESQEFQFHEAQPAEVVADARKQSQQFVFQAAQHPPTFTEQPVPTQLQQFGQQQFHQAKQQQSCPAEEIRPPLEEIAPIEQLPQQEAIVEQQQPPEDEEDEFGDFEETTAVQGSQSGPIAANGSDEQDNTVRINEEYLNSQEGDFYRGRQKELQQFVDSLPDYAFLFAKGFLP